MEEKYIIGVCVVVIILAVLLYWGNIIGFTNTGVIISLAIVIGIFLTVDLKKQKDREESSKRWQEYLKKKREIANNIEGGIY